MEENVGVPMFSVQAAFLHRKLTARSHALAMQLKLAVSEREDTDLNW
jgi:hypothetical protein